MKPTLLIMAAGIGSRYGGIKQLEGFGPSGETIVDYSIYDAIQAGFDVVVFVIQRSIEKESRSLFGERFGDKIKVEFVYQELESLVPDASTIPADRTKPWGTAHAVLVAHDLIHGPFAVINADDFYGRHAFRAMADFLADGVEEEVYGMVGYELRNTLSEHGTVSRGICEVNADQTLTRIVEHTKIRATDGSIESFGESADPVPLTGREPVSMNLWGFHPTIFSYLRRLFAQFLLEHEHEPTAEFYIPAAVDRLIKQGIARVQVLPTDERWFGVTYKKDVPVVRQRILEKIEAGVYPERLWR